MSQMTFEEAERIIRAKKMVILALDELATKDGDLSRMGDEEAGEEAPKSLLELAAQYAGNRVDLKDLQKAIETSPEAIAEALASGRE